jgi:hypothetical protein
MNPSLAARAFAFALLPTFENAFMESFAENKDLKLRIEINSVRFVTPDVAIEDGCYGMDRLGFCHISAAIVEL